MSGPLLASTAFLASAVEAVEALTIVLAVGVTRSWRSALSGTVWALVTLAAIVIVLGPPLIRYVPLAALKIAIGLLLLVFGLAWLRKAILRYSGRKALHDETAIYAHQIRALAEASDARGGDRIGFLTAYNAVLLEGLEVAVIVLTVGTVSAVGLGWAALGAIAAAVVVAAAGFAVRAPLSRVPENALKFTVGIMLTSFGAFWSGEGLGISWPGDDVALPFIVAAFLAVAGATIGVARRASGELKRAA